MASGSEITLILKRDGTVSGNDSCNDYTGEYKTNGDQISFGALSSTMKACEASVMKQTTTYMQYLQECTSWHVADGILELTAKDGQHVLRYERRA